MSFGTHIESLDAPPIREADKAAQGSHPGIHSFIQRGFGSLDCLVEVLQLSCSNELSSQQI